ncbi:hypothetical protein ACFL59_02890, partial [Planctomycetota bacterium]
WSVVLLVNDDPRIRSYALERIEQSETLAPGVARTLDDGIRAGRFSVSDLLAKRIAGALLTARAGRPPLWLQVLPIAAAASLLLVGLALSGLAWCRRRSASAQWLLPMAGAAVCGLLLGSLRVYVDRQPIPLELPGYLLAAAGTLALARVSRSRMRWLVPLGFSIALLASLPAAVGGDPTGLYKLAAVAAIAGAAALPFMVREVSLEPTASRRRSRPGQGLRPSPYASRRRRFRVRNLTLRHLALAGYACVFGPWAYDVATGNWWIRLELDYTFTDQPGFVAFCILAAIAVYVLVVASRRAASVVP